MMGKKQTQKTGKLRVGALRKTERLLTEHKRTENIRRRSDAILDAVSFAARQFLRTTDWKQSIQEVLERLGKATGVSRVYIFENNSEKDGNLLTSQRYEWCASGISPQIDNPDLQGFSLRKNGFERWEEMLGQGQLIQGHVKEFPESEKNVLTPQNIRSIVVTPIFVGQKWWGFIGFDECQIEREWSIAEIDALRAAAETLGAAIQQKFLNDTLKESEERYRTILENIAEGYYEVDLAGNFTFFNVSVSQLLGYSKDELLGMNNRQYMDQENAEKLYQAFNKVYRTGNPSQIFDWEITRKDGTKRYVESSISLIKNPSGQPTGFRGIVRDITERKRAEVELRESEIRLKMILDSIQTGVLVVDPDTHTIVDVNPAAIKLIGTSKEKIINQECHHFVCPAEKGKCPITDLKQDVDSSERILLTAKGDSLSIIKTVVSITLEGKKYLLENFTDITERKKAEEALSKSEERYRMLVEESFDGVWIQKGVKIAFANRRLHEMLGYEPGELEGRDHWVVYHPDYQALTRERAQARLRGESPPSTYEVKFLRKDGSSFWGEINAKIINYLGEPGIQVWARDINERKLAEEALKESEEKFRFLAENMADMVWTMDLNFRTTYVSPSIEKILGFTPEERMKQPLEDMVTPESLIKIRNLFHEELQRQKNQKIEPDRSLTIEVECYRKDGSTLLMENSLKGIWDEAGNWVGIYGVSRDITERMKAEETLRGEKEKFRSLSENAPFGMAMIAKDGSFQYINPKFKELFGYDLGDIPNGRTWFRKAYPDPNYRHQVISAWLDDLTSSEFGEKSPRIFKVKCKDGTEKIIDFIPVQLETGENLMTCEDITERVKANEHIKKLSHENEIIAEIGRIISSSLDIEGIYEHAAQKIHQLISFDRISITLINLKDQTVTVIYTYGLDIPGRSVGNGFPFEYSVGQQIMKTKSSLFFLIKDEKDIQEMLSRFPNLLPALQAGIRSMISVPLIVKDNVIGVIHIQSLQENAYTEADVRLVERVGNQIAGAIANAHLFKERIQAEEKMAALQEQLRQSQKMEAIGRLAGGIAHDFNNLLTVIEGYSELSLLGLRDGDPLKENIREIHKASERAANLTRQLLAFSRKQILEFKVLNLNDLIKDLDKMLHRILGEDIELIYRLSEEAGKVKIDPGQIEQVILNLAVNARDAMPSGGKLIIETGRLDVDEKDIKTTPDIGPGNYVRVSITDTGVGMTPEVKEHLFEPFFTTKAKGKGTGLGLSTVYGIIKQSNGHITVFSEPGRGTTFNIYLPRVEAEEDRVQSKTKPLSLLTGNETILLAEDEPSVRELATRVLSNKGYQIHSVSDGIEALKFVQEHPDKKIHLLLTDVVMPGMSGKDLADRLRLSAPDLKVLYISGYTDDAIVHHGVLDEGVNFIQKPFAPDALAKKVREVLDR